MYDYGLRSWTTVLNFKCELDLIAVAEGKIFSDDLCFYLFLTQILCDFRNHQSSEVFRSYIDWTAFTVFELDKLKTWFEFQCMEKKKQLCPFFSFFFGYIKIISNRLWIKWEVNDNYSFKHNGSQQVGPDPKICHRPIRDIAGEQII